MGLRDNIIRAVLALLSDMNTLSVVSLGNGICNDNILSMDFNE